MATTDRFEILVYQKRRQILKEQFQDGLILLLGNEESSMNFRDNWYPFRQDSTFLYYTGIDIPDLAVVIDLDEDQEILFGDDVSIDHIIWTGSLPSVADRAERGGIAKSASLKDLSSYLQKARQKNRSIRFLPPYRAEREFKLHQLLNIPLTEIDAYVSQDLINAVIAQRAYKSDEEIKDMEKAVNISNEMHLLAIQSAWPGMKEYDLVGQVRGKAISEGGDIAYPIILTINGQTLHNHYYGNTMKEGDMVLVDAGAETPLHYAGDLTRTFPVSKHFSPLQKDMYNIVLSAYHKAVDALHPGVPFRDIHLLAAEELVSGLKGIGLMKGDAKEAVNAGAHTMFFQCGLGHMIGLDVHDMEDLGEHFVGYSDTIKKSKEFGLKSLRLGKELELSNTLTVEPGIYIIPELIDRWKAEKIHTNFINYEKLDKIRDFGGIRIEDNFLITDEGSRKLGDYLPLKAEEIEDLRD
ncbi:aminopeptidase P family protein [Catalinimonas niigatensis]|uniref:aminopeptidase P family protein n=1 Tax=Catalinimonas niigatensis TaxID=1397264 RepID=UPI0026660842|nr:aminopeptidase P family protein [Catalinimonas niigatensis]WPP50831.1 Xaa-Pro aminopeptidase [Catalinimonas niigatensis]